MKMHRIQGVSAAAALAALACASQAQQHAPEVPMMSMDNVAYQGFLYAGGEYVSVGEGDDITMGGAMYVEVMVPHEIQHDYPIVFLHGAGQTGVDFLQTPDGASGLGVRLPRHGLRGLRPGLPGARPVSIRARCRRQHQHPQRTPIGADLHGFGGHCGLSPGG